MTAMQFNGQQQGHETAHEPGQEGVKVEKNSRSENYSFRVNRKPGQSWDDVFREVDYVRGECRKRFGGE